MTITLLHFTGLHPVLMYVAPVGLGDFYDDNFTSLHRAAPSVNACRPYRLGVFYDDNFTLLHRGAPYIIICLPFGD